MTSGTPGLKAKLPVEGGELGGGEVGAGLSDECCISRTPLTETAAVGVAAFDKILKFRQHCETGIARWKRHSKPGALLLPELFSRLWVNAASVAEITHVSPPTAYKILETFTEAGLLREITGAQRGRLYLFEPYLQLFK